MRQLSFDGQQLVNQLAQRHQFSPDAVASMLESVANGNGSMAQFSHPEFGGSGQWMQGGMTMIGDMFNNYLKNNVANLCQDLSNAVASQTGLFVQPAAGASGGFGYAGNSGDWWPAGLQYPNSTGAQNNVRYAYFASICRLAIDVNGQVTLYDTLDHQIGGFSQQQSVGGSLSFTSQYGLIDVASLPVVSTGNGPAPAPVPAFSPAPQVSLAVPAPMPVPEPYLAPAFDPVPQPVSYQQPPFQAPAQAPAAGAAGASLDVFGAIEQLARLRDMGALTEAEFSAKKLELLSRL